MVVYWKFLGSIGKFRETSCFQNVPDGGGYAKMQNMDWEVGKKRLWSGKIWFESSRKCPEAAKIRKNSLVLRVVCEKRGFFG